MLSICLTHQLVVFNKSKDDTLHNSKEEVEDEVIEEITVEDLEAQPEVVKEVEDNGWLLPKSYRDKEKWMSFYILVEIPNIY